MNERKETNTLTLFNQKSHDTSWLF